MSSKIKSEHSSYQNLLWLFSRIFSSAPYIVVVWILVVLTNAGMEAGTLLLLRTTVNKLVDGGRMETVLPWLTMLCLVFVVQQLTSIAVPLLRERIQVKAGVSLQKRALKKIGALPLEAFDENQTHNLIYRVTAGADVRGPLLMGDALGILEYVPFLGTSAIILGMISLWLPVVLICGVVFMRFLGSRLGKRERIFEVENTDQKRSADYYVQLLTGRQSAAETRLWGLGESLIERWQKTLSDYMSRRLRVSFQNTYQGVLVTLLFTVVFAVSLFVVSLSSGRIEAGLAALVLQALRNISAGMNSAQATVRRFIQHIGYSEDYRGLMALPSSEGSSAHRVSYPSSLRKGILLQNITYRYPGADTDALRDIHFNLHQGEILAIVGENGAGKTTLAHILAGLRSPTDGRLIIDGVDTATIAPDDLRNACTFVFQHPVKYPTTLRDNVTFGLDENQETEIQSALERVGLSGKKIPCQTLLGPEFGGVDISGGEWQRVALARSLLKKDAPLVIFDEPTANLDPLAEFALFEHFVALVEGKTAVLIAHRLGPTRLADRVAVLDNGALAEIGTPTELLAKNGKYAQMFAAQRKWYQ